MIARIVVGLWGLVAGCGLAWAESGFGPDGCARAAQVGPENDPSHLARVVRACIDAARYDDAMQVYFIYSSFTLFDQQRVRDESAHVVLQELSPWIFAGYPRDVIAALKQRADRLRDRDSAFFLQTCAGVWAAGPPRYRPGYMIRHGTMPRKHDEDWGHPEFDAQAAWRRSVTEVNGCPGPGPEVQR